MANKNDELVYQLSMTKDQARAVSRACELYARLLNGQLDELNIDLLLHESKDDICGRREAAMYLLLKLKEIYFPELHGHGHSYGIGHDAVSDRVWSTYMAIRHCMAWHEHPEGGIGCQFDRPFSLGNEPVPECIVKNKGCTGDEPVGDQYP